MRCDSNFRTLNRGKDILKASSVEKTLCVHVHLFELACEAGAQVRMNCDCTTSWQ